MVKKLFKHEFLALGRLMLPVLIAVLGVGVFTRIVLFFESDTTAFNLVGGSSFLMLFVAMFAGMFLAVVFGVVRYYKNLFSCEGYLSFTLPVTPAQHLLVKVLTAGAFHIAAALTAVLSLLIALSGEPIAEIFKAGAYIWKILPESVDKTQIVLIGLEFLFLLFVEVFAGYFLYYTCITIGQTAKKNRIMLAVGVYFIYYVIMQILGTVVSVFFSVFSLTPWMESLALFIVDHPYLCGHIGMISGIVTSLIVTAVYFIICHTIIRKKLNLE